MKSLAGIVALLGCLLVASANSEVKYGDQTYLEQQKDLLVVLKYVHQPYWNPELYAFGTSYKISDDYENYHFVEIVKEFVRLVELKRLLPKQAEFSIFNPQHVEQASLLGRVFMYAKNYETLAKLVAWARYNVNDNMFMYLLGLIATHRSDLKTLIMPAPYEVCPYQYIHSEAIKFAQRKAMQGFYGYDKVNGYKEVIVPVNYTGWFMHMNEDQKVSYFTEDVNWNAFYYNFHLQYPHYLNGSRFGMDKDRRGELFIGIHQQMLARYYLERLSNGLGHIPEFNWRQPVKTGYNPLLFSVNGRQMTSRPNNYNYYHDGNYKTVQEAEDRERRIRDVVDAGFIEFKGKVVTVRKPEDVDLLGSLIQGNVDAVDLHHKFHDHIVPEHLENPSTAARDPLFYQFYKRLMQSYWKFTSYFEPYTVEEIGFPGVKISDVKIDKIETFFENFDVDITNALEHPVSGKKIEKPEEVTVVNFIPDDVMVKARTIRLNHKPFSVKVNVQSEGEYDASVRVFIGPKYDEYGSIINFEDNRQNFVLLDTFKQHLKTGENVITRMSTQFTQGDNDYTTYFELYKRVLAGKSGEKEWTSELFNRNCRFPRNLLLPKGRVGGMTYQFYVIVTPFKQATIPVFSTFDYKTSCGIGSGSRFLESRSLLFPMDREIDESYFYTPNMHFEDVEIFFQADETANRYF
jgi:hypothetical protein